MNRFNKVNTKLLALRVARIAPLYEHHYLFRYHHGMWISDSLHPNLRIAEDTLIVIVMLSIVDLEYILLDTKISLDRGIDINTNEI